MGRLEETHGWSDVEYVSQTFILFFFSLIPFVEALGVEQGRLKLIFTLIRNVC